MDPFSCCILESNIQEGIQVSLQFNAFVGSIGIFRVKPRYMVNRDTMKHAPDLIELFVTSCRNTTNKPHNEGLGDSLMVSIPEAAATGKGNLALSDFLNARVILSMYTRRLQPMDVTT